MKKSYFALQLVALLAIASFAILTPSYTEAATIGTYQGNTLYSRPDGSYVWGGYIFSSFDDLMDNLHVLYGEGTSNSNNQEYTSDAEVDVKTKKAAKIGTTQVTLYGEVDMNDSNYAHVWFEYGLNSSNLNLNTSIGYAKKSGVTPYTGTILNLKKNTRYYFRAVAEDDADDMAYGKILSFTTGTSYNNYDEYDDSDSKDEKPEVSTDSAKNIDTDSAKLGGEVSMNDFENGVVFIVFGEDEDQIEDVEDDFDSYADIDEDGDDLQKVRVDTDLDGTQTYSNSFVDFSADTRYYYAIGVEYEDEDGDEVILLGSVKSFTTDNSSSDDDDNDSEPDAVATNVKYITDDSASVYGEVDMNDFENGIVFFVYGEDRDLIEDIEDDFDSYDDIDEDGADLQKNKVYSNLDNDGTFELDIEGLEDNTTIYYAIGVEYEDEDGDETIILGSVKSFTTD